MSILFDFIAAGVAFCAGITATLSGFGIGSLVTPLLSLHYETKTAIALVAIPHALATALRLLLVYKKIDKHVFLRFGLASAAGGLLGAWFHSFLSGRWLEITLGLLLLLAGTTGFSKTTFKLKGPAAVLGGVLSGMFGGLVGNQGGIRAAALLSFDLNKEVFIAVSTASALLVDAVRLPVYLTAQSKNVFAEWPLLIIMCVAVVAGTFAGMHLLKKINDAHFKKILSGLLLALGFFMLFKALH